MIKIDIKYLQIFIIATIMIVIVGYAVRSFAKIVLITVVLFVLFSLGFIWGPNDLNEKLGLNKVMSENSIRKIEDVSSTINEKREENAIIPKEDLEKAQGTVKDKTKEAFNFSLSKSKSAYEKLKNYLNGNSEKEEENKNSEDGSE